MKINGNAIKPGNVIEHDKSLWVAVKTAHVKPGKGGAFAQVELKNLLDGRKLNERFRSSDTVERVTGRSDEELRLGEREIYVHYASGMGCSKYSRLYFSRSRARRNATSGP